MLLFKAMFYRTWYWFTHWYYTCHCHCSTSWAYQTILSLRYFKRFECKSILNVHLHIDTSSSTPNWIGTFQMDGSCVTATCCYFTGEVASSQITNNQLQISGQVADACVSSTYTNVLTFTNATTFQTQYNSSTITIRLRLGADSSYISFVNLKQAVCGANGLRTSYNIGSTTVMNLMLVVLVSFLTLAIKL